jgi:hypothetical protein
MDVSRVLEGHHPCLYEMLSSLAERSGARAVCVASQGDDCWKVECQIGPLNGIAESGEILPAIAFGLNSGSRTAVRWWPQEFRASGRREWLLVLQVVARTSLGNVRKHCVILVAPIWVSPSPRDDDVKKYAKPARELVLAWSAWASYAREERRRYCADGHHPEPDEAGPDDTAEILAKRVLHKTIPWPLPFHEAVDLASSGIDIHDAKSSRVWTKKVLHAVCLDDNGVSCHLGSLPLCMGDQGRDDFNQLARLMPWRFGLWPKDEVGWEDAFSSLEQLRFPTASDRLDERTLLRTFADHFWRDWLPKRHTFGLGQDGRESLLRSCTILAQYLNGPMPLDEDTIQAIVWLVSRYACDVLGVEERLDVAAHLLQAARGESALHVLKQYYRDHFFHVLEVCFLGHRLLTEARLSGGKLLVEECRQRLGYKTDEEVLRQWYVAALFHDMGYTIDILQGAQSALRFYKRAPDLVELADGVQRQVKWLSDKLVERKFEDFTREENPGEDHGVVGALHLSALAEHVQARKRQPVNYEPATRAIAVHNHRRKTVDFELAPLGFLLILCDTVQEWNRPHLSYSTAPMTMLARVLNGGTGGDLANPVESSSLTLPRTARSRRTGKNRPAIEFDLRYGDHINENAGVFNLWIDASDNLQRLDLTKFPFDIKVRFWTPYLRTRRRPESQMDRLKEAAHQTHMNFLAGWFPKEGNEAVLHGPQPVRSIYVPAETDLVELDVRALSLAKPVTASMHTFRGLLSRWSRYNEDRIFAGDYAPEPPG